jgi:hypothetical protein
MSIVGESRFEDRSVIFKTWEIKALMFSFFYYCNHITFLP